MRPNYVMGNWKMHGQASQIQALLKALLDVLPSEAQQHCVIFPPAVYLSLVQDMLACSSIAWGAQNSYPADFGAYTGEHSAPMLSELGCRYVLVGHSERRRFFGEDEHFVAEKFHHVKLHDMIPVLCVGETQKERERGLTESVLRRQLLAVAETCNGVMQGCIVAYEPVWAIGTGLTAAPEQAQGAHAFIRKLMAEFGQVDAEALPILYGGSVQASNAGALFAMPDIDGGLVGGASLDAQQFVEIVKCISSCY